MAAKFFAKLDFKVVCANLDLELEFTKPLKDAGVVPYKIFEKYNMAIIGSIANGLTSLVAKSEKFGPALSLNYEAVQKRINELKAIGINRIIGTCAKCN